MGRFPTIPRASKVTSVLLLHSKLQEHDMAPPVAVSPLIKTARYSALIAGIVYGKRRHDELKPIAAEERRVEEEEKKIREEKERIAKQLAEASEDTILK